MPQQTQEARPKDSLAFWSHHASRRLGSSQAFALAAPQLADDYCVPAYFADDLFAVLGEDDRPDYRWLIIGPKVQGARAGGQHAAPPRLLSDGVRLDPSMLPVVQAPRTLLAPLA